MVANEAVKMTVPAGGCIPSGDAGEGCDASGVKAGVRGSAAWSQVAPAGRFPSPAGAVFRRREGQLAVPNPHVIHTGWRVINESMDGWMTTKSEERGWTD